MITLKRKNDKLKNSDIEHTVTQYLINFIMLLPLITLTLLMSFYSLVAIEYGHLPTYGNPDPKSSIFSPMMSMVYFSLLLTMASVPVWITMLVSLRRAFTPEKLALYLVVYVLPIIAFLLINYLTPVMVWFVD